MNPSIGIGARQVTFMLETKAMGKVWKETWKLLSDDILHIRRKEIKAPVTGEALAANFLIPFDENMCGGGSLVELCCDSLKDFNPMVHVSVEKGDLSSFDVDFFKKFDTVVINCCSLAAKKLVNEKCRKLSKRVAFYTIDCRDSCEIFVDLQNYSYANLSSLSTSCCWETRDSCFGYK